MALPWLRLSVIVSITYETVAAGNALEAAGMSAGTTVTTPATTNGTGTGTGKPLDPDAGTVDPNGDAGDPPTGTEGGSQGRGILPHRMR